MLAPTYIFCLTFWFAFRLYRGQDERAPYDRREIVLRVADTLFSAALVTAAAVWGVRHEYVDANEGATWVALWTGLTVGEFATDMLGDARRRRLNRRAD
jgi:hypothetical protein